MTMELLVLLEKFNEIASHSDDDITTISKKVDDFISNNEKTYEFSSLSMTDHNRLLSMLFIFVDGSRSLGTNFMKVVRILSRDKNLVTNIDEIDGLLQKIKTVMDKDASNDSDLFQLKIECTKCLCNWIYHSEEIRSYIMKNKFGKSLISYISMDENPLNEFVFYDVRLLFLLSALEATARKGMLDDDAINVLLDVMDKAVEEYANSKEKDEPKLSLQIMSEVFKCLFNIMLELNNELNKVPQRQLEGCTRIMTVIRQIVLQFYPFDSNPDTSDLLTHVAHIFVNTPKAAVDEFLCQADLSLAEDAKRDDWHLTYEGYDMSPIIVLLMALKERINIKNYMLMKEKSMAILTALCYVCRINPIIRKYLRQEVLPTLNPSNVRPEERGDMRGQIVRLMTTVDVPLKNMAADFLFVLCKENSERLIRYAGYGNSAGFLASRGLMIPGISNTDGQYSEDELSDFEGDIDAMTGATPTQIEDPFANMTESEKEEEMEKLMCMMDRLKSLNVIKPMAVGKDGNLMELQKDEGK